MTFERKNIGFFISFIVLGGVMGSALGTLIVKLLPMLSIIKANLTEPIGFTLEIISFSLRLNISSIVGIIVGIFIFKKV